MALREQVEKEAGGEGRGSGRKILIMSAARGQEGEETVGGRGRGERPTPHALERRARKWESWEARRLGGRVTSGGVGIS